MTDSYIVFTLKMESVSKNTIVGLKMMVKSGLEKIFFKFLHAGRWLFLTASRALLAVLGIAFRVVVVVSTFGKFAAFLSYFEACCSNLIKLDWIGSKWIELDQNGLNWFKLDQTCSNLMKLDPNGLNWFKLAQTCSNLIKLEQKGINWFKHDQTWTNWIK